MTQEPKEVGTLLLLVFYMRKLRLPAVQEFMQGLSAKEWQIQYLRVGLPDNALPFRASKGPWIGPFPDLAVLSLLVEGGWLPKGLCTGEGGPVT